VPLGYTLHTTRADDRFNSGQRPIAADEWLAVVAGDPELRLALGGTREVMSMTFKQPTLLVAVPALLLTVGGCSRSTADKPLPAVTVEAVYPGANAQVVADTVAAPIEQQVNGVEKMVHLSSRCTNDGTCRLTVTFEQGMDLDMAQVLVQNRVALAQPLLPDAVKRRGVATRKAPAGLLLMAAISSPDDSRDVLYLSNYAALQVQDELARVPGVSDVLPFGEHEPGLTVWLDPDKLASRGLTAGDVTQAFEQQNAQVRSGALGKSPAGKGLEVPIAVNPWGRLLAADELQNIVLKADAGGVPVRLKDVARVELAADTQGRWASLNGKPVVILGLYPSVRARPREVSTGVGTRVSQLRERCPQGVQVDAAFNFTPAGRSADADDLLLDLTLPPGASAEQTRKVVQRCEALVREVGGVQDVLALSGNPFDLRQDRPCLLVRLGPGQGAQAGRGQVAQAIRARLEKVEEVTPRLRDLSGPGGFPAFSYAVDLAVSGPEADRVRELATNLAERLRQGQKLTDVWADQDSAPRPQLDLDIDRTQARMLGVSLQDVFATLQTATGAQLANDSDRPGRGWQVKVRVAGDLADRAKDLQRLKVRNAQGQMVPLGTFVTVREVTGPAAVNRLDGRPMVEITANLAADVPAAQVRTLCEGLAEEARKELGLPAEYRLTWLREPRGR
jgi:multidrug efflux pump subunit AcrB